MTSAIRTRRRGFTLVELLVATALTMLIMTILAMSFQTAMDSLSHLRSAGELQDRLRIAGEKMKSDLRAPHFDDEAVSHGSVSNVRFDRNANATPTSGFFRVDQGTPSVQENTATTPTSSREYSTVATTHAMMMTVRLPGTSRQSIFTAPHVPCSTGLQGLDETYDNLVRGTPPRVYGTRWGIVSWFLTPSPESTRGTDPAFSRQPMFTLHRRVRLLAEVPNGHIDTGNPNSVYYTHNPVTGLVMTPRDVAAANRPTDMYTPLGDGSDIVLSNVLSFEIKAEYSDVYTVTTASNLLATSGTAKYPRPAASHTTLLAPLTVDVRNANNQDFPYDDLPPNPLLQGLGTVAQREARAFDTGLPGGTGLIGQPGLSGYPQSYRIKSIQIKLRVYDPKTMNTRQVTLVQEM